MKTLQLYLIKKKYRELKESIRMMNSQTNDAVIKRNEVFNNSLK